MKYFLFFFLLFYQAFKILAQEEKTGQKKGLLPLVLKTNIMLPLMLNFNLEAEKILTTKTSVDVGIAYIANYIYAKEAKENHPRDFNYNGVGVKIGAKWYIFNTIKNRHSIALKPQFEFEYFNLLGLKPKFSKYNLNINPRKEYIVYSMLNLSYQLIVLGNIALEIDIGIANKIFVVNRKETIEIHKAFIENKYIVYPMAINLGYAFK